MTNIKKRGVKLPFPSPVGTKVKDMANGVVLWQDKNVVVCK
jgi:hypothetical protein